MSVDILWRGVTHGRRGTAHADNHKIQWLYTVDDLPDHAFPDDYLLELKRMQQHGAIPAFISDQHQMLCESPAYAEWVDVSDKTLMLGRSVLPRHPVRGLIYIVGTYTAKNQEATPGDLHEWHIDHLLSHMGRDRGSRIKQLVKSAVPPPPRRQPPRAVPAS